MGKMTTIGNVPVFEVHPRVEAKGGLIVIHEVWGLTDHIKDVAERFAKEGYIVLAPNLLNETDIEAHASKQMQHDLFNPERRNAIQARLRELMTPIRSEKFASVTDDKLKVLFNYLYRLPEVSQKIGVVGYCFGGSYSFNLAMHEPRLRASVPYYGHADGTVDDFRNISCPVLAFYGEKDERLMQALPDLEKNMHDARVDFTARIYTSTGHAFFNDTNPFAYNKSAAKDAWKVTLEFLEQQFID